MPEGDTVYRAARLLDEALRDQVLVRCDIRVPAHATVDLRGHTVDGVISRGKNVVIRVDSTRIRTHLKMEGRWHLYRSGEKWRSPAWQARIVLATADREAVGFQLGLVEVFRRSDEERVFAGLGPDLLGPDWDREAAVANLREAQGRPIGEALLDQRNLAGIGNVYRSEICFLLGVRPDRSTSEVDLPAAVDLARRLLEQNKDRVRRRTTPDDMRADLWVYGRRGPCLRCGTAIRSRRTVDEGHERIVFWCPRCQE